MRLGDGSDNWRGASASTGKQSRATRRPRHPAPGHLAGPVNLAFGSLRATVEWFKSQGA
jgi:hypothetical protein